ncbi:MAG: HYR domain-containing protein, partial [Fimbriimonadales bacterium]
NAPTLYCEAGPIEELSKCRYRQTFRFWAVDKSECGNRSQDYFATVTWKIDTEPPVVNNVPDRVDLGCNPNELPSCDWLIATYNIVAKDNCVEEGNAPTLYCEAGPIEELSKCRYRQTFRFWAVDKSECGNRSQDYIATVTWKIDAEPPVVNNVPDRVDLGCNPNELPSCDWLIATYNIVAKDNCVEEGNAPTLYCEAGPIEELSKCRYRQTFRFWAVDKSECGNRSQDYFATVTWKIDAEPPVVNNVPDRVDLGCNPNELPSCDWLIATYNIVAKDNCVEEGNAPTLYCEAGPIEELSKCRYRQTFRFWAVDKSECGNRSQDYFVTVTWQIDTEPPTINNLPRGGKLPCNTRPSCEYLIQRYNIEAKDNCDKEPQLYCEAGELEQIEECQYRQTFRFWAVDKCGNRTQDYFVTFFWKEDTEPPVLHNLPEGGDLGCNPSELPTCETVGGGVTATDNCDPNPRVTCFANDLQIGCLRIRSFNFVAVDECGNVATAKVFYYWTVDTTPPVVRCPDDIVVQADPKECFVEVTWRAKADDDCDPNPRLVCNPPSGSLFPLGTTIVTCTATDRCGNTASCSFRVTVLGFICGTKFHDLDGDGVRDANEPGLAGWTIELVDPATNTVLQTVVTGPDGRYCFLGLALGDYIVREVMQPGWVNTTPIQRRMNLPRDCGKQVDFGNRRSQ